MADLEDEAPIAKRARIEDAAGSKMLEEDVTVEQPSIAHESEPQAVVDEQQAEELKDDVKKPSKNGKEKGFVPVHGNYRGYYTKRRFNQDPYAGDERLALIPKEWLQDKRVLDIGCNMGKVSIEIAQSFGAYRVTGVDIDGELIKRAQRQIRIAWSAQDPSPKVQEAAKRERERTQSRHRARGPSRSPSPVDPEDAFTPSPSYFPAALSRMFGFLPALPSHTYLKQYVRPTEEESKERSQRRNGKISRGNVMPKQVCLFPHNLRFKKADWVGEEIQADKRGYDCILAFSVSKWIHLDGGDAGLMEFFTRIFTTLHPAGRFILEPQPWSSYTKASRLSDELKESYNNLKLRPEEFENILLNEIGFKKVEKLSEEDAGGFKRPLHVYIKAAGSWV